MKRVALTVVVVLSLAARGWSQGVAEPSSMVPEPDASSTTETLGSAYQPNDGSTLTWQVYTPPTATFGSGPWPAIAVIHGGGFFADPPAPLMYQAAQDFANAGYVAYVLKYRLGPPGLIPNQPAHSDPASGRPPEQTDDCEAAILAIRADTARCNGHVVGIGGSGGGYHVAFALTDSTTHTLSSHTGLTWNSSKRLEAGVSLSGAYALDDRASDPSLSNFVDLVNTYTNTTDNTAGLATMRALSPYVMLTNDTYPLLMMTSASDPMPPPQLDAMQHAMDIHSPAITNYQTLHLTGGDHAWAYWQTVVSGTAVSTRSINFINASLTSGTPSPTATPSATPTPSPTSTPIIKVARFRKGRRTGSGGGVVTALHKAPHGIFYLLATDATISSQQSCWTNPAVDGVRLRVSATYACPFPATYNWASMDAASALAAANGKQWSVGVSWGSATPSWVGAASYNLPSVVPDNPPNGATPLPWDANLLAAELAFIDAFAARYDGDPNLTYVVVGGLRTGYGFETFVSKDANDDAVINDANEIPKWISAAEQLATRTAQDFTQTPALIAAGNTFPGTENSVSQVADHQAPLYANAGNMCASLKATSNTGYAPNALIDTYAPTHPCAFQMVSTVGDQSRTAGPLSACLAVGVSLLHGRGAIEVYANDLNDPANLATLQNTSMQLAPATW